MKAASVFRSGGPKGELIRTRCFLFRKLVVVRCNEGRGLNKCWASSGISEVKFMELVSVEGDAR